MDEQQDLRNGIMEKFNLCSVGEVKPPVKKGPVSCSVGERTDTLAGLAAREQALRAANAAMEENSCNPGGSKIIVDEEIIKRDSMDMLAEVMENKAGEIDHTESIRENANKLCVDEDIIGHIFGL